MKSAVRLSRGPEMELSAFWYRRSRDWGPRAVVSAGAQWPDPGHSSIHPGRALQCGCRIAGRAWHGAAMASWADDTARRAAETASSAWAHAADSATASARPLTCIQGKVPQVLAAAGERQRVAFQLNLMQTLITACLIAITAQTGFVGGWQAAAGRRLCRAPPVLPAGRKRPCAARRAPTAPANAGRRPRALGGIAHLSL